MPSEIISDQYRKKMIQILDKLNINLIIENVSNENNKMSNLFWEERIIPN